jgi:hypothetical protein
MVTLQHIYCILSGSLFTPRPYPTKLAEATIRPARFTAFFMACGRPLFTLGIYAVAMIEPAYKRTAMQIFGFFTIIKFRANYF